MAVVGRTYASAPVRRKAKALKVFLTMDKGVLFKQVWRGWFVGVSVLFTPILLLVALFAPEAPPQMAFGVVMVPVIAAFQGVIVGGLVLLGVTIWPLKAGKPE